MGRRMSLVLLLAILAAATFIFRSRMQNWMTIVNASGQVIPEISVQVSGYRYTFQNIQPDHTARSQFVVQGDDQFRVRGKLADGKDITADAGYITNSMFGERVKLTVRPDGSVEHVQGQDVESY